MKKIIFVISLSIALVLTSFTVMAATNKLDLFSKLKKATGLLKSQDGVIFSLPGEKENRELVKSFDPSSGKYTKEISAQVYSDGNSSDSKKQTKKISFKSMYDKDVELEFEFIKKNNREIVFLPTYKKPSYQVNPIPGKNKYVLEYDSSLYMLDIENSTVRPLLNDSSNGYEKSAIIAEVGKVEGLALAWGVKSSVNLSGDKIAFFTNRKALKNGGGNGEIWIKDLVSGMESPIYDMGAQILGWDVNSNLYIYAASKVVKIDNISNNKKDLLQNIQAEIKMSYPNVFIANNTSVDVFNVESLEKKTITGKNINDISNFVASPDEKQIAFSSHPAPQTPYANVIVMDTKTLQYKMIEIPEGKFLQEYSWGSNDQLLVTVHTKGNLSEQETFFIEVSQLQ